VITKVKRGRPRNPSADLAILDAAAAIMAKSGYRGMTVGAVAAAAGVTEPTVYLRHPTKHDLAVAALARLPMLAHPPDTGDARRDLTLLLGELVTASKAIGGPSITGVVLAEEADHPELLEHWRKTVGAAALHAISEIVERGRHRGDLRRDVDAQIVADLVLGAYIGHYTHVGPPDRAWAGVVIATLWPGVAARRK
jgi:AcrR family transcriptional regulator